MMHAIRPLQPADRAWILARHQAHYCGGEGFDASFPPLVARRLDEVLASPDPARACGWVLWRRVRYAGSASPSNSTHADGCPVTLSGSPVQSSARCA